MTGMEVMKRCAAYPTDVQRLKVMRACALDAATRATRAAQAAGGSGGHSDRPGDYAARANAIDEALRLRAELYDMELRAAADLAAALPPAQGMIAHMRLVRGMTVRQTAGAMHMSENSVRGMYRRAACALMQAEADMPGAYRELLSQYQAAEKEIGRARE